MKPLPRSPLLPLALLALGGATVGACAFIDRFPDVAPDPTSSSGSGDSSGSSSGSGSGSGSGGGAEMCTPASTAPCYEGPPGTQDKGPCKGGTKTCDGDGRGYSACAGEVLPQLQSCKSAVDTNCDGVICAGAYAGDKGFGGVGDQQGTAIATNNGIAVITGFGTGSLDFGNNPTSDQGSPGTPDAFLASFDTSLGPRFSHRFSDSAGRGVAVDRTNGDVVLVGSTSGDVDFGGGKLPSGNPAGQDVFAARFSAAGAHLSSQRFGDAAADQHANAVTVGGDGNAVLTGALSGTLDCKNGTTLTGMGAADVLVAKLDPSSKMLWCKSFGDGAAQEGTGVTVAPLGEIIVVGWFSGSINFGGGALTSAGTMDLFVAAFDPAGAHLWSSSFGGSGYAKATGVAVDSAGNIFIAGFFKDQLKITASIKFKTKNNDEDAFVIKLDKTGKPLWASVFGNGADQEALGVAVDAEGNAVLTGKFAGGIPLAIPPLFSAGGFDAFAEKLDPSGKSIWMKGFGDVADQSGSAVAIDSLGAAWLTGSFAGSVDFGGGALVSGGATDVFLAKLTP